MSLIPADKVNASALSLPVNSYFFRKGKDFDAIRAPVVVLVIRKPDRVYRYHIKIDVDRIGFDANKGKYQSELLFKEGDTRHFLQALDQVIQMHWRNASPPLEPIAKLINSLEGRLVPHGERGLAYKLLMNDSVGSYFLTTEGEADHTVAIYMKYTRATQLGIRKTVIEIDEDRFRFRTAGDLSRLAPVYEGRFIFGDETDFQAQLNSAILWLGETYKATNNRASSVPVPLAPQGVNDETKAQLSLVPAFIDRLCQESVLRGCSQTERYQSLLAGPIGGYVFERNLTSDFSLNTRHAGPNAVFLVIKPSQPQEKGRPAFLRRYKIEIDENQLRVGSRPPQSFQKGDKKDLRKVLLTEVWRLINTIEIPPDNLDERQGFIVENLPPTRSVPVPLASQAGSGASSVPVPLAPQGVNDETKAQLSLVPAFINRLCANSSVDSVSQNKRYQSLLAGPIGGYVFEMNFFEQYNTSSDDKVHAGPNAVFLVIKPLQQQEKGRPAFLRRYKIEIDENQLRVLGFPPQSFQKGDDGDRRKVLFKEVRSLINTMQVLPDNRDQRGSFIVGSLPPESWVPEPLAPQAGSAASAARVPLAPQGVNVQPPSLHQPTLSAFSRGMSTLRPHTSVGSAAPVPVPPQAVSVQQASTLRDRARHCGNRCWEGLELAGRCCEFFIKNVVPVLAVIGSAWLAREYNFKTK